MRTIDYLKQEGVTSSDLMGFSNTLKALIKDECPDHPVRQLLRAVHRIAHADGDPNKFRFVMVSLRPKVSDHPAYEANEAEVFFSCMEAAEDDLMRVGTILEGLREAGVGIGVESKAN